MSRLAAAVGLLALVLGTAPRATPAPVVDVDNLESRRALLIARILSYDSSLATRAGAELVLAVLFKKKSGSSEKGAEATGLAFKQVENLRISGMKFRRVVAAFSGASELEQLVDREGVDAFFLSGGLEADTAAIRQVARKKRVLTIGTTEAQVKAGVSLVVLQEGTRMAIVVNWAPSREEGATFGTDLLRLARVIR